MFGVWTKLKESIFKSNNQINSTVTTRTWVLQTEMTRIGPSTRLVSKWANSGGPRLLEWLMLFLRMNGYCIVLTKLKVMSPYLSWFSKICCQLNFPKIFKRGQIILEPCRNSKCPIRWLLWWHKTLPGAIWKARQVKVCKKELLTPLRKCRVNPHDVCSEMFPGY